MADCVRLKYSPSKAAAKVNKSRRLFRPPSNTSLRNSCYRLVGENRQHSSSQNVYGTCEIAINTRILRARLHLRFLPPPPCVNRAAPRTDQVGAMTSEYCCCCCSKHLCAVIMSSGLFCFSPWNFWHSENGCLHFYLRDNVCLSLFTVRPANTGQWGVDVSQLNSPSRKWIWIIFYCIFQINLYSTFLIFLTTCLIHSFTHWWRELLHRVTTCSSGRSHIDTLLVQPSGAVWS